MESQITPLFFLVVVILSVSPVFSATDSVSFNSTSDVAVLLNDGQTLVSEDGTFEVGFFSPNGSHRRYLGIWYRDYPSTVVWVANREHGVPDKTGYLCFNVDGNLEILDGIRKSFWLGLEKLKIVSASYNLRISDSGNLILTWVEEQGILWQSFDDPTDTFLSGMKMVSGLYLTSWTSHDDPSPGNYMFQLDDQQTSENQQPEFIILNNSRPFWNTGGQVPLLIPELLTNSSTWSPYSSSSKSERSPYSSSYAATRTNHSSWRRRWVSYSQSTNALIIPRDYSKFRILMGFDGRLRFYTSPNETKPAWVEPVDICDLQWPCGSFASCNREHRLPCKCLPGFVPKTPENWDSGDFSEGCTRNSQDCRKKSTVFLNITVAGVEKETGKLPDLVKENKCRSWCLENCNCQAYSFDVVNVECRYWSSDVKDIEETSSTISKVNSLMVRVQDSDIESTKKDCKPCGADTIPYPLSTGPDCGDPRYSSFVCDAQNGRLSFTALNRTYMVTRIDKQSRKFFIQAGKENCNLTAIPLNQSLPFQIDKGRCNDDMGNVSFGPFHDGKSFFEMAIVWDSPPEPVCGSDDDCKTWPNSSCRVKVGSEKRCICDGSSRWDGTNVNCTGSTQSTQSTQSVGVGLSALPSKILKTRWRLLYSIILGCVGGVLLISGFALPIILYMRKTRRTVRNKGRHDDNLALRMYDSEKRVKEFINSGNEFGEDDKRDLNVPFFDLDCILAATDFFSIDNKLGQGGFGPVYKGKFPGGQEIAVKRLSTASLQGLEEFKNEAVLIAKLQHKNLVRLLGYCVEGNEKMLLYEYMPHKSLDFFIFDQSRCMLLDWDMRFNIIMGIARGLLYLHHDSRLTIIHRDLKTSNILLDEEMNPRISDFGMARIMGGKVTEANTVRVVGTYGYMSPEYAADGNFSIKSDVFSFGVVLLEIISGKKNTGFYKSSIKGMSLLGHVWRCWREENVMEVMDQSLSQTCVANEFLRCVNVALLCVQEDPNDRPTMANVLFMLGSEAASLGCPKEPAFTIRRDIMSSSSSSLVTMEITQVEAR